MKMFKPRTTILFCLLLIFYAAGSYLGADQAYIDSLYMLAETIYQYQLALNAMESMVELAADQEGGYVPAGMEVPAYSSVYDGLAELEDSQLEEVMYALASDL